MLQKLWSVEVGYRPHKSILNNESFYLKIK
ncbi:hypothetical protein LINGRAHAP2_LOCUS17991 [Linum grandiflorum]